MSDQNRFDSVVEIRVRGRLAITWSEWFDGLSITTADQDETVLSGHVVDQAALHGLLAKVRDLGLPLLSVNRVEGKAPDDPAGDRRNP